MQTYQSWNTLMRFHSSWSSVGTCSFPLTQTRHFHLPSTWFTILTQARQLHLPCKLSARTLLPYSLKLNNLISHANSRLGHSPPSSFSHKNNSHFQTHTRQASRQDILKTMHTHDNVGHLHASSMFRHTHHASKTHVKTTLYMPLSARHIHAKTHPCKDLFMQGQHSYKDSLHMPLSTKTWKKKEKLRPSGDGRRDCGWTRMGYGRTKMALGWSRMGLGRTLISASVSCPFFAGLSQGVFFLCLLISWPF